MLLEGNVATYSFSVSIAGLSSSKVYISFRSDRKARLTALSRGAKVLVGAEGYSERSKAQGIQTHLNETDIVNAKIRF